MKEDEADTTAHDDTSSQEQVDKTATTQTEEEVVLSPDELAEAAEKAEEEKKQASERTSTRRRQRKDAKFRRETEARHKAEIDAAYWKGKAEAGSSGEREAESTDKPQQDDFETYGEFSEALVDWKIDKANEGKEKKPPTKQANAETTNTDEVSIDPEELKTFNDAGAVKYGEDFSDMMEAARNNEFPTSQIMAEFMMAEEEGIDMAMHFYDNPDEAKRIAHLSPRQQVKELDTLGETLKKAAPVHKKQSSAPAPIESEKGSSVKSKKLEDMDTGDYIATRLKQKHG